MLGRDTEWRQGCLLASEGAHALDLIESIDSDKRVVVISHDCDLPNDAENFVEVIVGSLLSTPNPTFTGARNPRRLHLKFTSKDGELLHIELSHANKIQIKKEQFAKAGSIDRHYILPDDEKRTLKQWLAARYGRPAFPNTFERRLRKKKGKKTVEQHIAKILEPSSQHLVGLFFDLGEDRNVELAKETPYCLSIAIVYDAIEGGEPARKTAEEVAEKLRSLFEGAYGTAETATEIALETCNPVADTFITLADLRRVDQWRLEYISLREDPSGDFLAAGEMPP